MKFSTFIFNIILIIIFWTVTIETRSILISHTNPLSVKHFEPKLDPTIGYWSPSTSSIDWCERNYAITQYIAEFWNCISSFVMCILAGVLFIRGAYNKIENRFLLLSVTFGIVGLGSAYFHGTLTHFGQMADELPMVYSMIVWWFILFRMNEFELKDRATSFDILLVVGIFYAFLWTYLHSLSSFVIVFQVHFALMVLGGIIKLVYLYRQTQHHIKFIFYLVAIYFGLLIPAMICWIIDQQFCERFNSLNGFNPQLHAWWHLICAIDCHIGIVCGEAMRFLSLKYQEHQAENIRYPGKVFKPQDHLHLVLYLGLPFVDYSKTRQIKKFKTQ